MFFQYKSKIPKNNNDDAKEKVKNEKQNVGNFPFDKIDTIEELNHLFLLLLEIII